MYTLVCRQFYALGPGPVVEILVLTKDDPRDRNRHHLLALYKPPILILRPVFRKWSYLACFGMTRFSSILFNCFIGPKTGKGFY